MTESGLKEDWLFTNALVAFVGALLMGQIWEPAEGTFKLLFFIEVPNYTRVHNFPDNRRYGHLVDCPSGRQLNTTT